MKRNLKVEQWAFWSPEAASPSEWREHWSRPVPAVATAPVPSHRIPPMQRRRMSRMSKMAVQVALEASDGIDAQYLVFCSRHGELVRTLRLLSSIASGDILSPTDFSQSVHNTSSGLYSIIERSRVAACSLASGSGSFAYGWLEAECYLAGHRDDRVLLVDCEDVLPEAYQTFVDAKPCAYTLALVLTTETDGGLCLDMGTAAEDSKLPIGPLFLDWCLSGGSVFDICAEGQRFTWERKSGA